jgi:hypothetical protein
VESRWSCAMSAPRMGFWRVHVERSGALQLEPILDVQRIFSFITMTMPIMD